MSDVEVAEKALSKKNREPVIKAKDLLSSGSTMVNLAATGRTVGCFAKGHYYWFVGDSTSGKTWLALSVFAEATLREEFDDYRLIYDNSEDGALMDIERFFGTKVMERIEPPAGTKEDPQYSEITEDLYFNIDDAVEDGRPFIYIIDSLDALETNEDRKKFKELKKHRQSRSNKKISGSYGMTKAKVNSAFMRRIVNGCRKTKSIVIVISQTRDNPGFGAQFNPKTAAGGRSLKFYATLEMWTSVRGKVKRIIRGKKRNIGIYSRVQFKKNRVTGRDRTVVIPIYPSLGIDDIGSCVNFLQEEKHWKGTESRIKAKEFDFDGDKEDLIKEIEQNGQEKKLKAIVKKVWQEIEFASRVERKSRYS